MVDEMSEMKTEVMTSAAVAAAEPKQSHKMRTILLVVLALLLVGGAGAGYWYLTVYTQTPEQVMAKMFTTMQKQTSATVDATLEGSGTGIPTSALYVPHDGAFTKAVGSILSVHALAHIDDAAKVFDMNFTLSAMADGNEVSAFAGEMRSVADVDYVQFTTLSTPVVPIATTDNMSVVLNRFITVDRASIAKSWGLDSVLAQSEAVPSASSAAIAHYLPSVLVITAMLPEESIYGIDTRHYAYAVDKNTVGALLDALAAATPDADYTQIRELLGTTNDVTGELWIGKSDSLLYKAMVATTLKGAQQFVVTLTFAMSDYGEAVTVTAPEVSTPLQDVMVEVLTKVSEAAKADDDGDGLNNRDEDKYGSDKNTPDTDGDGFSDGDEVKNGYNPAGDGKLSVTVISTSIVDGDGSASFGD